MNYGVRLNVSNGNVQITSLAKNLALNSQGVVRTQYHEDKVADYGGTKIHQRYRDAEVSHTGNTPIIALSAPDTCCYSAIRTSGSHWKFGIIGNCFGSDESVPYFIFDDLSLNTPVGNHGAVFFGEGVKVFDSRFRYFKVMDVVSFQTDDNFTKSYPGDRRLAVATVPSGKAMSTLRYSKDQNLYVPCARLDSDSTNVVRFGSICGSQLHVSGGNFNDTSDSLASSRSTGIVIDITGF